VAERTGKTVLPPNSVYPIFEGRIQTGGKKVTETKLTLQSPELWLPASIGREQFEVSNVNLSSADARPRLDAIIKNIELTGAEQVEVVATLFNEAGKPITASQTFIDYLEQRSTKEIVFTWPHSIAKTVRSCMVPSDVILVLDRSGSMAADGGTPPEPLESAKKAAQSFSNFLQPQDNLGYLSYATTPTTPMEQTLTGTFGEVQEAIASTVMGSGGVQYTNMGEAFRSATVELVSERHRDDARKVIVLMTDGDVTRPVNPKTGLQDRVYAGDYAREQATLARKEDIIVYTIGFGDFFGKEEGDVTRDVSLIKDLASDPANYYEAPTATQLQQVYKQIAESICESGASRIEVIAKTPTNFAPLR
jgi:Mg-chelatase subunit ChlD